MVHISWNETPLYQTFKKLETSTCTNHLQHRNTSLDHFINKEKIYIKHPSLGPFENPIQVFEPNT
jgi:hypothetical protein